MENKISNSEIQVKAQYKSIVEMVQYLNHECQETQERAIEIIQGDPLSVCVRCSSFVPVGDDQVIDEYEILLCIGGPAVRIVGSLNDCKEPETATLEHQDWGIPWTPYFKNVDSEILLQYARCFYFGE